MPITNNNKVIIDQPVWEQLNFAPAASAAGVCLVDDNDRFIYVLFSATSFWRFDTWGGTWQQLANPPGGTLGAGTCLQYTKMMGDQFPVSSTGIVYGSVLALISNGVAAPTWQRYNIATNAWSALSVTNLPATFGTDGSIAFPSPAMNNYTGSYHATVLQTITATASAAIGATSVTVSALPTALPANAVLNFGTTASPKYAVLTAAAAAAATSITVRPLTVALGGTETALWYDHMYLVGNNATQMYRYTLSSNAWSTTSANAGNPALAAVTAAPGAGGALKWLPGDNTGRLVCIRGAASASVYLYDLVANTWSTLTFHPATETFTTGTCFGVELDSNGKPIRVLMQKDATNRIYRLDVTNANLTPMATQWLLSQGAAAVGDRASILKTTDGIQFFYMILNTSSSFVRSPLFF